MRLRIHHVLFAGFAGVVGLLVVLTLVLVGSGLTRELKATFRADVERQLALGAVLVEEARGSSPNALARMIAERVGYRVTIIDTTGAVLGESHLEPRLLDDIESHAERPEVADLLRGDGRIDGRAAFAERASATVGLPLLYGARLTRLDGTPMVLRIAAPQTEVERAVERVQRTVAAAGLLAMMVALVAAYLLARLFARPLVALADHARGLARGGAAAPVPLGRVVELRDVAVAFNRLGDELRERLAELGTERDDMQTLIDCMAEGVIALTKDGRLLRTNRTARALLRIPDTIGRPPLGAVVRNPELREALEASLRGEVAGSREVTILNRHLLLSAGRLDRGGSVTTLLDITELRRLESVRRDFVANASHELKTPLTSIRGFAEALVEEEPPEAVRRRFVTAILNNTMRLQHLVDDLLDLSRLESGGWTAGAEPVDLAAVAREAWALTGAGTAERRFALSAAGDATAIADHQGLVQVFRNLMENAVRHTRDQGHVRVTVRPGPEGFVTVEVSDDGEGIPGRALPRIFERFYRTDASRARDVGGTGLGLAIVKHLVVAMGGEVEAESTLGRGTVIRFTLPAA